MAIKIDLDSISIEVNKIFGNIYFENENIVFPERQWNDFILIVVNWWLESLSKFVADKSLSVELFFMDGSFSIKINRLDDNILKLYFVSENQIKGTETVLMRNFVKDFLKEANTLIRFINKLDKNNEELGLLKKNYDKLKTLMVR
jgi:hypothetical protein